MSTPPTDPKKIYGEKKPPMQLIPSAIEEPMARVLEYGAKKYGEWNWRKNPVEIMTYIGAIRRHVAEILDGNLFDEESGQPHLAHIAASCAIVLDAERHGMLIDNRPPSGIP